MVIVEVGGAQGCLFQKRSHDYFFQAHGASLAEKHFLPCWLTWTTLFGLSSTSIKDKILHIVGQEFWDICLFYHSKDFSWSFCDYMTTWVLESTNHLLFLTVAVQFFFSLNSNIIIHLWILYFGVYVSGKVILDNRYIVAECGNLSHICPLIT